MKVLRQVREKKGLTQVDVAAKLGIGVSTYNQYENGTRSVPKGIAEHVADILGVGVTEIFLPNKFTVRKATDGVD